MELQEVSHVKVVAGARLGKLRVMEVRFLNKGKERIGYKYINVDDLKEKGVIQRATSVMRAEAWLNTEEGKKWAVEEAVHTRLA